jgi:hypothetical protein
MKQTLIATFASSLLILGTTATANALDVQQLGPGGVYVGHDRDCYRDHYNDYARDCRVVITHHTNRFGEEVTERRRICD